MIEGEHVAMSILSQIVHHTSNLDYNYKILNDFNGT
jgi:hypothetical protein